MKRNTHSERVIRRLEQILPEIQKKSATEGIGARFKTGRNPPRIYVIFPYSEQLQRLAKDFSEETDELHRQATLELAKKTKKIAEIMRKQGLTNYPVNNPYIQGSDILVHAYGYRNLKYAPSSMPLTSLSEARLLIPEQHTPQHI